MATPLTLVIGDVVTHPQWPPGERRTVVGFTWFQYLVWNNGRKRLFDSPTERIVSLDKLIAGDDDDMPEWFWMEAGLVPIGPP